jgi:hypothetical protein
MPTHPGSDPFDPEHDPTIMGNDEPRRDVERAEESTADDRLRAETVSDPRSLDAAADVASRDYRGLDDADTTASPLVPPAPPHGEAPGVAGHLGEAAGGLSGALTGAAIGSVGGPVGTVIGGIAGAVGGWWAGRAIADAASSFTEEEDRYYRERHESLADRETERSYEEVRPAYQIGHLASLNPEYAGRDFEEIEQDLRHGWTGPRRVEEWEEVRSYAREAYDDASARRVIGPDAERPITPVRDDVPPSEEGGVELSEAADPRALGDDTAVTGYAGGLTDEDLEEGEAR